MGAQLLGEVPDIKEAGGAGEKTGTEDPEMQAGAGI
jgi:hypothetical protein